ncbi:hypothetical protein LM601614_40127 [Listeria monocytogenes]|nr:hypothetical protein LM601614_40127 [Listeria monocytogenes]
MDIFNLNKYGVLVGNYIQVNENGQLYGEPKHFLNANGNSLKR